MADESVDAAFDCAEGEYDHALAQGISVSGEDRGYFAVGRLAFLRTCLGSIGETPRSVLDFGCGSGGTSPLFVDELGVRDVVGVDVSPRLLESARRVHAREGVRFLLRADYSPEARLDLAFCNGVFHHVPESERPDAFRYIHDALRPGGLVSFWENNPWSPAARFVMSRIPFDRDAIMVFPHGARRMLRQAGFEILRTDYLFVFPRLLSALRPLERPLSALPLGAQYQILARRTSSGLTGALRGPRS